MPSDFFSPWTNLKSHFCVNKRSSPCSFDLSRRLIYSQTLYYRPFNLRQVYTCVVMRGDCIS